MKPFLYIHTLVVVTLLLIKISVRLAHSHLLFFASNRSSSSSDGKCGSFCCFFLTRLYGCVTFQGVKVSRWEKRKKKKQSEISGSKTKARNYQENIFIFLKSIEMAFFAIVNSREVWTTTTSRLCASLQKERKKPRKLVLVGIFSLSFF